MRPPFATERPTCCRRRPSSRVPIGPIGWYRLLDERCGSAPIRAPSSVRRPRNRRPLGVGLGKPTGRPGASPAGTGSRRPPAGSSRAARRRPSRPSSARSSACSTASSSASMQLAAPRPQDGPQLGILGEAHAMVHAVQVERPRRVIDRLVADLAGSTASSLDRSASADPAGWLEADRQDVPALPIGVVDDGVEERHRPQPAVGQAGPGPRGGPPGRSRSTAGPCRGRTARPGGPSAARSPSRWPRRRAPRRPPGGPASRRGSPTAAARSGPACRSRERSSEPARRLQ